MLVTVASIVYIALTYKSSNESLIEARTVNNEAEFVELFSSEIQKTYNQYGHDNSYEMSINAAQKEWENLNLSSVEQGRHNELLKKSMVGFKLLGSNDLKDIEQAKTLFSEIQKNNPEWKTEEINKILRLIESKKTKPNPDPASK